MRVYMLNPPYYPHFGRSMRWQDTGRAGTLYYPIWLSYATSVIEQEHEVRLVDAPARSWSGEDVIKDVKAFNPDLIVIDSSFPSLKNDLEVAKELKESSDAKTVLVGPPASQFPDKILRNEGIDMVARYEYDFTVKEVADALESGRNLDGIGGASYKNNGEIFHNSDREFTSSEDLDKIPFVSRAYKKHLNIRDYFLGSSLYPEVQIFTGRGCTFNCTFCSWPQTLMGRKYRVRSIPNLLDELEWVRDNLEVKEVFFEDDTFTIDRKRVTEFCRLYKERDLDMTWACNARADLDYNTMKEMKKANCRLLIVGYESGSDEILKKIRKGLTVAQIKKFAENARKTGLLIHGDFIIGLPGENRETINMTKKLIEEAKPDILQVSVATPFPGTEFYQWCREYGYLVTEDPNEYLDGIGHQKSVVSYPWLSNEEITKTIDSLLKDYYLSPRYVPIAFRQVFRKHGLGELRRILYSARMFLGYVFRRKNP